MTAEQYVKEVGKLLKCRASKKKEIKKQLLSDINNSVSNGERLDYVLGRMGIPWDYANKYNDNFDKSERKAAKREKNLKIWGIVLLIIVMIAVIVYLSLPKWSDISESTVFNEEQVKTTADTIIRLYSNNEYKAVTEYMNDEMKQVLNAATLEYSKTQISKDFGELRGINEMSVYVSEKGETSYAMVQVIVDYANNSVLYTITFDESMKLAGFYIK